MTAGEGSSLELSVLYMMVETRPYATRVEIQTVMRYCFGIQLLTMATLGTTKYGAKVIFRRKSQLPVSAELPWCTKRSR